MKLILRQILSLFLVVSCLQAWGEDRDEFLKSLRWTKGPATGQLKNLAEIYIPEGFMLTDEQGTRTLLEATGNPSSGAETGCLAPTNATWFVFFEFSEDGYVKDDDKDKLNADKILESIKQGTAEQNKERIKRGVPPLNITGWELPPRYNTNSHNLEWAIRGESEGKPVINYNTRILGRKGVMEADLVVKGELFAETLPVYVKMMERYKYKEGQRYAEFRQGDKIAKYGLAALVVGGGAALALKTGLFTYLLLFVKKLWKVLVVAVAAVGSFIKRLVTGEKARKNVE
jgi:uncharacterized membrane-anchored protein